MLSEYAGYARDLMEILASANGAAGAGTSCEALGGLSRPTRGDATNHEVLRPFQGQYHDCTVRCP